LPGIALPQAETTTPTKMAPSARINRIIRFTAVGMVARYAEGTRKSEIA